MTHLFPTLPQSHVGPSRQLRTGTVALSLCPGPATAPSPDLPRLSFEAQFTLRVDCGGAPAQLRRHLKLIRGENLQLLCL
jgi:hypothetical protein